jgi:predicted DsbA family dithiol-disulfide isomerase
MAMTSLAPAITKTTSRVAKQSTRAALRIVADASAGKQANQRFFALFMTALGAVFLLALLFINTLLAQDAFELSKLQADLKLSSDQYEAITREIERISSPAVLANEAQKLGMKPSVTPTFLNLDVPRG